jgi:polysaccharide biosynthesis/export protein
VNRRYNNRLYRQFTFSMHVVSLPTWRKFLAAVIWVALIALSVTAPAAAQTPEQLEIFRNLTPEQQQALLQQIGTQQGSVEALPAQPRIASENERRRAPPEEDEPLVAMLRAEDTVIIDVSLPGEAEEGATGAALRRARIVAALDPEARRKLAALIDLLLSGNPYRLDRDAQLNLPGFAPIAVGGLTELQATQRLALEAGLQPLEVQVTRLPLEKTGVAGLKAFGYDFFENVPSTFSPVTDVPVPADYVIGPGDLLAVQLFGSQGRNLRLPVNRDGTINFPDLGPISISGMTFSAARQTIESRVAQQLIGVRASVSMAETRAISVWVTGDARQPGSYTVSGLATMTSALFASGGVKDIGSLRDIQLKRQGNVVRRLDLYDLLIQGDTSDDAKLLPGDVIFIPPVGDTVSVDGEVKRPRIYELRGETSIADVIRIAGGFTPDADATHASLTRIEVDGRRIVLDVNLTEAARNGDRLRIARLRPQIDLGVELEGHVHRAGPVAWREGLRLTDVIGSVDELKPNADQHYILIRRENAPDRRISPHGADLTAALAARGSAADVLLAPRDRIFVFDLASGRERIIQQLLQDLQLQSDLGHPTELVSIEGRIRAPGQYPQEPGMRVSDLLRAGGGLLPSAYGGTAELVRYVVGDDGSRRTVLVTIDLAALRRGDAGADLPLQSSDHLLVKETPDWREQESVTLRGEVRFPLSYRIRKGETLRQLLERAGGLTSEAFPEGSVFTRRDLKESEQRQLDQLSQSVRSELAVLSLQAARMGQTSASEALQAGQSLAGQLQSARATGRFLIDLPGLLAGDAGSDLDVTLRDGDELIVPKHRQEVTVIGEVQNTASYLHLSNLKLGDYIAMSGGTTRKADKRRIYVVRADGQTATRSNSWLARNYETTIKPGDTIVVPLNTERMPRLPFWQAVTQILYNVAVSVAAVNSF